jgi:pimeloyl-ACP methyl ester carboxylesterase
MHGIGGAAWSWSPQALALSDRYRCYLWEARGHGAAAPAAAGVTLSDYYQDGREALDVIRAAHETAPVVAAHSMGGLIAMALAADDPRDVAGLFLVDPVYAPGGSRHPNPVFALTGRSILTTVARAVPTDGVLARTISRAFFRAAFTDRAAMELAWQEQRNQPIVEFPAMLIEAFDGGFVPRAFARELNVPVLLLEGSFARRRPRFPALVDDLRCALGNRFRYEVIAGGHYLQLDRPALVTHLLREFVAATFPEAQDLPA